MKKKFFFGMMLLIFLGALVAILIPKLSQKTSLQTLQAAPVAEKPVLSPSAIPPPPEALVSSETPAFKAILSAQPDVHSVIHEVKAGDNLTKLARQYKTTAELIKKINALPNDRLRLGMKLKIATLPFSLVIDKSQNTLILKGVEEVLKTYPCSTGLHNSTPVGIFKIKDKLMNPTWYKAGAVVPFGSPQNVLGTRWLGITKAGYGIHGTTEPEKIGQQVTSGCVRMRNEDVEELYAFVPTGTEVTIVD